MPTSQPRDIQAAPPDDGGVQGSYTRPEDALMTQAPEADRQHGPPLHHDTTGGDTVRSQRSWLPVTIAVLVMVVIFAMVFGFTTV